MQRHFEAIAGAIRELLGDPLDTDDHRAVAEAMAQHDAEIFELDGRRFAWWVEPDETMGAPWDEHCGHGPVSDWTTREMVLHRDSWLVRYYDFAEACVIARREGWGSAGDDGLKPRARSARAAMADYERLRQWCNDVWSWVGVVVTEVNADDEAIGETASLWGIESDAGDYLAEVARELAGELLAKIWGEE